MHPRASIEIDLVALRDNLKCIRQKVGSARVLGIVKANAYGHGLVRIARALSDIDGFGVACLGEALQLRKIVGCKQKIVVLGGCLNLEEYGQAAEYQLDLVIHNRRQLKWLIQQPLSRSIIVWLKFNTGMNRLGFAARDIAEVWQALQTSPWVQDVVLMSHFSSADKVSCKSIQAQFSCFQKVASTLTAQSNKVLQRSLANSAALLTLPDAHFEWVRPGIALYGVSAVAQTAAVDYGLRSVMTFRSQLIAIQNLMKGDTIGYHGHWCCPSEMRVGIVGIGYGDGYPYDAPDGTKILLNEQPVNLIGRVCMDMLAVDLRSQPTAKIGDPVILWGKQLPIEVVARQSRHVPVELLCGVQRSPEGRLSVVEV